MRILSRIVDWIAMPYSLFLLLKNPRISWKVKLKAGLILAAMTFYILNPMDLIPDVTPFIGWLDDLVIIPLMMSVAGRIIPEVNFAEIRQQARTTTKRVMFWTVTTIIGLAVLSLSALGLLIYLIIKIW